MAEAVTISRASEGDLDFVSQEGYLPERIVRRKIEDGDVFVATRGGERVARSIDKLRRSSPAE